jgi:predicted nucleotidyltransferase
MTKQEIENYLEQLNDELESINVKGEICIYGGAVMCLVYNARPSTKDVDAIFEPVAKIREVIQKVAENNNLSEDWLNDSVKGFVVNHNQRILFNWSNLKIYVPKPDYLLAMKTLASRVDTIFN